MFLDLIQLSFVPFVGAVISLFLFLVNKTMVEKIRFLYVVTSIVFIILILVDTLDFYFANLDHLNYFRYITSTVGYALRPIALLIVIFTLIRYRTTRKISWLICMPAMINFGFLLINFFTGIIFKFNEANEFIRGPLGLITYVISAIYLIMAVVFLIKRSRRLEKIELFLVLILVIGVVVSVFLEATTKLRCLLNGVGVISTICYFLYLNTQTYRRDELTNILNRRAFYNDIIRMTGKYHIVCVDMNNLKEINDNYGHLVGDSCLIAISKAIKDNIHVTSEVYRVGGDEFVIISKGTEEEVKAEFEKINEIIKSKKLSIAYGYAASTSREDFEKAYIAADIMMYKNKEAMKAKMKKEGK